MEELSRSEKRDMSTKEICKLVRAKLKESFPACKFSIIKEHHNSISVSLMAAPFNPFIDNAEKNGYPIEGHHPINHFYIDENPILTPQGKIIFLWVHALLDEFNYDNSDIMTDYFDVNFYENLHVGKWDKPFQILN